MNTTELEAEAATLGAAEGVVRATELSPMLCASSELGLSADGYVYELKLDGVRVVVERTEAGTTLTYRSQRDATPAYPELVDAVNGMADRRLVLDAEVVAIGPSGFPDFELLGQRIHIQRPEDARRISTRVPVILMVFDCLQIGDRDLRELPLVERKKLLKALVTSADDRLVQYVDDFPDGQKLFDLCLARELEGIVAKRVRSSYREGPHRSDDWIKIKRTRDAEFVVITWTEGRGSRGDLGALEVASYDDAGQLVVRGRVGSGLDLDTRNVLMQFLRKLEIDECAARGELKTGKERHFVQPRIVISIRFKGWSKSGKLVAPVFRGVRVDVKPEDCHAAPPRVPSV